MSQEWAFETRQIHVGGDPDPATGARAVPIYQTTSFEFRDAAHAQNLFALAEIGNIYTRIMNPTQGALEARCRASRVASPPPSACPARSSSSGQAAETLAILTLAEAGDHVVASPSLYGGTYNLFHYTLPKMGIEVTLRRRPARPRAVALGDPAEHQGVLRRGARQPAQRRVRHRGRQQGGARSRHPAHRRQHRAHPVPGIRPIEWGADIVVHSLTKFIGGHGTSIGGAIIDGGTFDFAASGRFANMTEPDPSYHGLAYWPALGPGSYIIKARVQLLRDLGMAVSPFNAFLFLQGLETLSLRMDRHWENAQKVAEFLAGRDDVEPCRTPAWTSSPWHERATTYFGGKGYGSVLAFDIKGGREAGQKFVEALQLHSHVANIGDVRSLVIHPASTTHSQLTEEEQASTGVRPGLVRLSVGLEAIDDILADLELGFAAAKS
jgi:O-acetylhomoserine (thiol)-lyase